MKTLLTQQVLDYQSNIRSKKDQRALYAYLQDQTRIIVYTYPVRVKTLSSEEALEFLLSMENRIVSLIHNFTYDVLSFESYVKKVAFLQSKMFMSRKRKRMRRHNALFSTVDELDEQLVSNQQVEYKVDPQKWSDESELCDELKKKIKESSVYKTRLLQIILLCADELHPSQITFLSEFIGIKESTLAKMISGVYQQSEVKRARTQRLVEIKNKHYHMKEHLQQELHLFKQMHADPLLVKQLEQSYDRSASYFRKSIEDLRTRPNHVTHSNIAKQLNMPKGTVDSGLSVMKKYLKNLVDEYE